MRKNGHKSLIDHSLELVELHAHVGGSVHPAIMWSIAHEQGIKLPTKDYWEFFDLITVPAPGKVHGMTEYDKLFHWTELIQSSPLAIERSVYEIIGGAYRKSNITLLEVRFNPMKRNRRGEQDLDHIIMAALRGMDRAMLEFPYVQAGIILMLDRTFTRQQNEVIIEKALRYKKRGVIGIDLAGPQHPDFAVQDCIDLYQEARNAGLGTTFHTGEEGSTDEIWEVVRDIRPDRIGHGFLAAGDDALLAEIAKQNIVLELCPTSNIKLGFIKSAEEYGRVISRFREFGIKFTINTDGPEMLETNLRKEMKFFLDNGILTKEEVVIANTWAREASFLPKAPHLEAFA